MKLANPLKPKIGWHIVRLVDRKVSNKLPLHIVKKELAAAIEAENYDAIKALINYMKRKAKIRYIPYDLILKILSLEKLFW